MDDLYDFLVGGAPKQDQVPAIVDELRRRRSLGELGALTGDRVLSPFGSSMVKQSDQYAGDIANIREKDVDNKRAEAYQSGMLEHNAQVLKATLARDKETSAYHQRMADAAKLRAEAAMKKVTNPGNFKKVTDTTRNKMLQHADTLLAMKNQLETFNDEYTQRLGPGKQSLLPNAMAQLGVGTKGSKEAQEWWSNWGRFYTLPMRNLLFGATLTPHEQAAWASADINPAMDPAQIKKRISDLFSQSSTSAKRRSADMIKEGYDPSIFGEVYGDSIPELIPKGGDPGSTADDDGGDDDPTDEDIADFTKAYQNNPQGAVSAFKAAYPNANLQNYIPAQ